MRQTNHTPHVVIVGGGAGGLELAARLGRKFGKKKKAIITLADTNSTHLWKPLLHEIAAGTLDSHEDEVSYFSYANQCHFYFQLGSLQGLNKKEKVITLASMRDENDYEYLPQRSLHYDILILAIGSIANDFSISGVREHCFFLDNRKQADIFQQHLLKSLLHLSHATNNQYPFKIAIIGGGATGVELVAELHYAVHQLAGYGLKIAPSRITFILIESTSRILSNLPQRISTIAHAHLSALGVKIYTNERVTQVTEKNLHTQSGHNITADVMIWTAGIKAPDLLSNLDGLEVNKSNQLIVKKTLQTTRDQTIFAFGDCAYCLQENHTPVPARAQAAHQQAVLLTKTLYNYLKHKPLPSYRYHDYGSLVTISRYSATGVLMSRITKAFFIEGKLAQLAYWTLYKRYQLALYGFWRTAALTVGSLLKKRVTPQLKLH